MSRCAYTHFEVSRDMRRSQKQTQKTFFVRLAMLGAFHCIGFFLGHLAIRWLDDENTSQLSLYIERFFASLTSQTLQPSVWDVFVSYFRYPVMAFLLGFCQIGTILLPLLCAMQGFFLSFSVSALIDCLGRRGLLTVISLFGIRSILTIPCTLLISAIAIHREGKNPYSGKDYRQFLFCTGFLFLGVILEVTVVPRLLHMMVR